MIQLDNTKGMELYSFTDDEIKMANAMVPSKGSILPNFGHQACRLPAATFAHSNLVS